MPKLTTYVLDVAEYSDQTPLLYHGNNKDMRIQKREGEQEKREPVSLLSLISHRGGYMH